MNVIFTCGGTGGHINPAIAVANALRERQPESRILFIGAAGEMEENLVPRAGYQLIGLPSACFHRGLTWEALKHNVSGVGRIRDAVQQCRRILRDFQPDVILGTGGYASFPALYAGTSMKIPACVHESNAVPGLATKLVARRVDRVLVSFAESAANYPHPERVEVAGMPVRREFVYTSKEDARRALGLKMEDKVVVSAFGSLGAMEMNKMAARMFAIEQRDGFPFHHIHATGAYGWEWMPQEVANQGVALERCPALDMREYIYDMPTVMAAADVIISRAGASSCNEIAASGTPCILIPSPNVTNDHQMKNARVYGERGAAIVLAESACSAERLYEEVTGLLADEGRQKQMSRALLGSVVPDSAERICGILEELAKS